MGATAAPQHFLKLGSTSLEAGKDWTLAGSGIWFVFAREGKGVFQCQASSAPLAPGDVLVTRAELSVTLSPSKAHGLRLEHFSLQPEHLIPLLRCEELCLMQTVTDALKTPRHYPAATPLADECHRLLNQRPSPQTPPDRFDLHLRGHLLHVAATVLREEFEQRHPARSGFIRMDEHVARVLEQLTAEEILSLSVGELAERFSCSRRHLNRLFHEHFGVSIIALKMEMRLLKAVSLLRDPDAKVIHVAEQSGFNHLGLFNTCFKRRFGMSPGEWRKRFPQMPRPAAGFAERDSHCWMRAAGLCAWSHAASPGTPAVPERPRAAARAAL